mgnify:FL=1
MMNSAGSFRVVSQTSFLLWICTCNDSSTLSKRIVILNLPGKKAKNTQVIDEEPFFLLQNGTQGKANTLPKEMYQKCRKLCGKCYGE